MKKLFLILTLFIFASCQPDKEGDLIYAYGELAEHYDYANLKYSRMALNYVRSNQHAYDSLMTIANRYDSLKSVYEIKMDSVKTLYAVREVQKSERYLS